MSGYKLSYVLATCLIIGAFISLYNQKTSPIGKLKTNEPWILFMGGMILGIVGYMEYRKADRKAKVEKDLNTKN